MRSERRGPQIPQSTIWEWLTEDGANSVRYLGWKQFWEAAELRNRVIERALTAFSVRDDDYFDFYTTDPTFRFLGNDPHIRHDIESMQLARSIDEAMSDRLLSLEEPLIGYAGARGAFLKLHPPGDIDSRTQNTCRHTLMLTILLTEMKKENGID